MRLSPWPRPQRDVSESALRRERKAALIAGQREKPAMASLRQEHQYGLSCGRDSRISPTRTLFHVKLTDTAVKALDAYQNRKVHFLRACAHAFGGFSLVKVVKNV